MSVVSKGNLFPPELLSGMIDLVKGKSSLARLSAAEPVPFEGADLFTFDFDNEVSILGENDAKVNGGVTVAPKSIRPYKFEYGARFSAEFMRASEDYQLRVLDRFSDGFAKRVKRQDSVVDDRLDAIRVQEVEHVRQQVAMAPAFRSALAALTKTDGTPRFPELGWGAEPGVINGLPVDTNSTVSFNSSLDRALLGNFRDFFRWGYASGTDIEIIEYGNPDNDAVAGDLKGHNQIYIRGEVYIGWGILVPAAFARIVAPAPVNPG